MIRAHDRPSRELARQWNTRDLLSRFRKQFYRPAAQIYFDGSSLGLCSQEAERALLRARADWKTKESAGWVGMPANWKTLSENLAGCVASLLGAMSDEVAIVNSRALNLHQLSRRFIAVSFIGPAFWWMAIACRRIARSSAASSRSAGSTRSASCSCSSRRRMAGSTKRNSKMRWRSRTCKWRSCDRTTSRRGANLSRSACERRHHRLDLSLSFGLLPHALDEWDADFAFWEHSFFGNAGPGAASGLYLNRRHFDEHAGVPPGLASGWNDTAENCDDPVVPAPHNAGTAALQIGSPAILSLAPLNGALRSLEDAGLDLTHFLRSAIEAEMPTFDFAASREPERRGGHLSLAHPAAREICEALRARGLTAGFCESNLICLAPAPLVSSFMECWDAVQILRRLVDHHARLRGPERRTRACQWKRFIRTVSRERGLEQNSQLHRRTTRRTDRRQISRQHRAGDRQVLLARAG